MLAKISPQKPSFLALTPFRRRNFAKSNLGQPIGNTQIRIGEVMTNYQEATSSFVTSAKGVAGAVDMLKAAIAGGNPEDISFASELVANAADSYMGNTENYQRRGFDEMAIPSVQGDLKHERLAGDLLAGALVDLNVANTIMTVARAAETPDTESLQELDVNAERLNSLVTVVALPLGRSVDTPVQTARFGFDEVPTTEVVQASATIEAAKQNYEKQVIEVFTVLVAKSKEVVLTTVESIKGLDLEKLLAALGSVGQMAAKVPPVSKLVAKAIAIVLQAFEKLSDLLGIGKDVELIRTLARKVREYTQDPTKPLAEFLELSYSVDDSTKLVQGLLEKTSAAISSIDEGAKQLVQLRTRFAEQMALLTNIVGGVSIAKRLVNFFSPEAATLPIFGSIYVLAIAYAVLAGMDFADSGGSLSVVHGVVQISEELLA